MVNVLLVEDDRSEQLMYKRMFDKYQGKYSLLTATTGQESLEVDLDPVDVVLLDLKLPDISGIQVLQEMLKRKNLPIIMVTGEESREVIKQTIKQGASDYIVKKGDYYQSIPLAIDKNLEIHKLKHERKQIEASLQQRDLELAKNNADRRTAESQLLPNDIKTRKRAMTYRGLFVALLLASFPLGHWTWHSNAELHSLMETVATVLELLVGILSLVRFYSKKDNVFLFVGAGFLGTSLLNGYHVLFTYKSLPYHLPSTLSTLTPWSGLMPRLFLSIFLWLSFVTWKREERLGESGRIDERMIYLASASLTALTFVFFLLVPLPHGYNRILFFHRPQELIPSAFCLLGLSGYLRKGHWKHDNFEYWLTFSLIVDFASQTFFMALSRQLYDMPYSAAHLSKNLGHAFVLIGLMVSMYELFKHAQETSRANLRINEQLQKEIAARNEAHQALRRGYQELEMRVHERTKDLNDANEALRSEINERKLLESQIVQVQKLESIGQLAAGIAHEINTPIQYVGDNTRFLHDAFISLENLFDKYERLLSGAKNGTTQAELVSEIEKAIEEMDLVYLRMEIPKAIQQSLDGAGRVAKIVRAMKEFSHPGSAEKMATDINHAIENTIVVARNEWKYVSEVETDFEPKLPLVHCLLREFNQVILNLIINSAHAISDVVGDGSNGKGTIAISTRLSGDSVEIRINDTGAGIPESIRHKIFTPFFTTKGVGKGTGQGLSIAYSIIVKKHGGTISFETKEGKGTTFIIRLPIDGTKSAAL